GSDQSRTEDWDRGPEPHPSQGFGDLAGLQAPRAHVDPARRPVVVDPDPLEVRVKPPPGGHHRVATAVAERGALLAHMTDLCHRGEYSPRPVLTAFAAVLTLARQPRLEAKAVRSANGR